MVKFVLLCLLTFLITLAETIVSTWEGKADRNATSSRSDTWSKKAAGWAGLFEAILFIDVILVARESSWLAVPAVAAAVIGKYWAVERRRKKWRARVKKPKRPKET